MSHPFLIGVTIGWVGQAIGFAWIGIANIGTAMTGIGVAILWLAVIANDVSAILKATQSKLEDDRHD